MEKTKGNFSFAALITAVLIILIIAISIFSSSCDKESVKTASYPKATDRFFVNDFSDVLDKADEDEIYSYGAKLYEKTNAQVVATTVKTTNGKEISEYALELGRKWGIGDSKENNGVLILLASDDRDIYIAVGYGLEGALPDSKTGRLLDTYAIPYLSKDDFSKGILSVYKAVVNEVYIEYNIEPEEGYTPADQLPESKNEKRPSVINILMLIIILIVVFRIFGRGGFFFFGGPGGFGGFRGGGFGGSGGFSSGGGFRGGGGSFGGGGSGRSF